MIIVTLCGCALLERLLPIKQTRGVPESINKSNLGSTVLSLLSTEHNHTDLPAEDVQAAFSYYCNEIFYREISSDSISFHYTISEPEVFGIDRITPTFGEGEATDPAEAMTSENYLWLLKQFPYDKLTQQQQLTYSVLKDYLEAAMALSGFSLYAEPLSKTIGIQAQLPVLLCEYAFYSEQDVEDYLLLLSHLPAYFEELAEWECKKADAGMFMHPENALAIIEQCSEIAALKEENETKNFMITAFDERLNALCTEQKISGSQQRDFKQRNIQALSNYFYPAYEKLANTFKILMQDKTNNAGLCAFPEGKSYYQALVKKYTGSEKSIASIKHMLNQRILSSANILQTLAKQAGTFADALSEIKGYTNAFPEAGQTLTYLRTQLSAAFPMPAQTSCEVLTVPSSLSEYLSPAFYLIPPIDAKVQNCIYVNQPQIHDELGFFTTLAHEGYPGHLYQNAMFSSTNPDLLRQFLSFPGYIEGWATYAELYSLRFSGLSETAASIQEHNTLLTLCMYAMADIHVHYDGYTEDKLQKYLSGFGFTDTEVLHQIYLQLLAEPANYLKYVVGCLEFLELKETCQKEQGDAFNEKNFHEKILSTGPCSFAVLREQVR